MRLSSPSLAAAFIAGAREQGADVVDFGMISTDMLYYAVGTDDLDGGAQITASHNPKQYNGCKMVGRGNMPLSGDSGISDIRDMIAGEPHSAAGRHARARTPSDRSSTGTSSTCSASSTRPSSSRSTSCSTPAAAWPARRAGALQGAAVQDDALCFDVDGTFPTHEANPLIEENRRDIVAKVKASAPTSASRGTATPTAASSSTRTASSSPGDFITALLAEAFLLKEPGATIVYDLRASYAVKDVAARTAARR